MKKEDLEEVLEAGWRSLGWIPGARAGQERYGSIDQAPGETSTWQVTWARSLISESAFFLGDVAGLA